jgi:hypothetical protein
MTAERPADSLLRSAPTKSRAGACSLAAACECGERRPLLAFFDLAPLDGEDAVENVGHAVHLSFDWVRPSPA